MRKLTLCVVIAALLYGGYWFVGRFQVEMRLTEALAQANDGPYTVRYDVLSTTGFPSRFDTTITEVSITDQRSGLGWSAAFFQIFALAYRPNEVIAIFAPEQIFTVQDTTFTLFTEDMRASGKVAPNTSLSFDTATFDLENPRIRAQTGDELAMARLFAAMRLAPETTQSYDLFVEAGSIVLPQDLRRRIDPTGSQPPVIGALRLDGRATLSAPLALIAPTDQTPQLIDLTLNEVSMTWGAVGLTAIGDMAPDAEGRLNGSITVTARNWQTLLQLAIANGAVKSEQRFLVTEILRNLDETPQIEETLTLTIGVSNGTARVGGFALPLLLQI